eukprot:GSChrysophyteH1.ASY1.ANO1.891.1 assembled CDS
MVYRICTVPFLVRHSESMIQTSYKYLGARLTNAVMKYSFFGHFCAGENEVDMKPVVTYLERNGIGSIFDYAAESDVNEADVPADTTSESSTPYDSSDQTFGRVYHYIDEAVCDKHAAIFENCIKAVHKAMSNSGFAAMKITALGDPNLLRRMATTLSEIRLKLENLTDILVRNMHARVDRLAELASSLGVRLMIDAEHSYLQPAIDNIAYKLSKKYNRISDGDHPIIFNTYQMYLKDSERRLQIDYARSKKDGTHFAIKLVRGAYMVLESANAKENGYTDPIHESLQNTHDNYNKAIKSLIGDIAAGNKVELMIATHNQESIELAISAMSTEGLKPSDTVYFGQLLGMADHLTFTLGSMGYQAYKYVPYGKVNEVMPYLIRRAQENADVLGNAKRELSMIQGEIGRRLNPF